MKGRIAGSATENYLLEKIRVVQPASEVCTHPELEKK